MSFNYIARNNGIINSIDANLTQLRAKLSNGNLTAQEISATNAEIADLNNRKMEYEAANAALEDEKRMEYLHKIYPDADFCFSGQLQAAQPLRQLQQNQ